MGMHLAFRNSHHQTAKRLWGSPLSVKIYQKIHGIFLATLSFLRIKKRNVAVLTSGCEGFHCTI